MDEFTVSIYSTEVELINAAVAEILEAIRTKLASGNDFHLALTGGSLGVALARELANSINKDQVTNWSGLNIWWGDERFVPIDSTERNDLEFCKTILPDRAIDIHRALGTGDVNDAARELAEKLSEIEMDLIILGMGPDGHVASLFPGKFNMQEKNDVFAIVDSPKPPPKRITFSISKINRAREVWLIASGESKAAAVTGVIENDTKFPASHIKLTRLLVDSLAFLD